MATRDAAGFAGISGVIVAIGLGLYALGSPAEQRARRFDERRVEMLQDLTRPIDEYWRGHGRLPVSLAELARDPRAGSGIVDPETGREYGYHAIGDRSYQLCAQFARPQAASPDTRVWAHPAGPHCFDLEVHEPPR